MPLYHMFALKGVRTQLQPQLALQLGFGSALTSTPLRKGKVIRGSFQSLLRAHNGNKRQELRSGPMAFLGDALFAWLFKEEAGFRQKAILSLLSHQSLRLFIRMRSKRSGPGKFVAGSCAGEDGYT